MSNTFADDVTDAEMDAMFRQMEALNVRLFQTHQARVSMVPRLVPAAAYLREHHARITHIHVKDRKRNKGPNVEWGTGDTPIRECLVQIRDNSCPIQCVVEREFKGTETPFEETRKDLAYMRRMLIA